MEEKEFNSYENAPINKIINKQNEQVFFPTARKQKNYVDAIESERWKEGLKLLKKK